MFRNSQEQIYCYCFFLLTFAKHVLASEVYLTMKDMKIVLPKLKNWHENNSPLANSYAKGPQPYTYSIHDYENYVHIGKNDGVIYFTEKYLRGNHTDLDSFRVTFRVHHNGENDVSTLKVITRPGDSCDHQYVQTSICFWQTVRYVIKEGSDESIIGSLSSPFTKNLCNYNIYYKMESDSNDIKLVPPLHDNDIWSIATTASLDRSVVRADIRCFLGNNTGRSYKRKVELEVLDIDNNPPVPQDGSVRIRLKGNSFEKGRVIEDPGYLIFLDKDYPEVNNYKDSTIEDREKGYFSSKCTTHKDSKHNGTAIHCKLILMEDNTFGETYNLTLRLNDTSLKNDSVNSAADIHITLTFDQEQTREKRIYLQGEYKVFRTAAPFARVCQPYTENPQLMNFSLHTKGSSIFNITETGIVYVADAVKLRKSPEYITLNISWTKQEVKDFDEILIRVVNEPNETCKNTSAWKFCAQYKTSTNCQKSTACAIGTGGSLSVTKRQGPSRCIWRGDKSATQSTHLYSTCTPDDDKCPDGKCDSLENLDEYICPQDCSKGPVTFPTIINPVTQRGIDSCGGTLWCDRFQCSCEPAKIEKSVVPNRQEKKLQTPAHIDYSQIHFQETKMDGNEKKCGTNCVIGITSTAVLLMGVIGFTVIMWRLKKQKKNMRHKNNEENLEITHNLSNYIENNMALETLPLNFHMPSSRIDTVVFNALKKYEYDVKWEFPRSQLIMQQILGEGEFGRVLKAKALNISGHPGYTTVAVKTLKQDAQEAEFNDLFSEYQLLKETSHKNIIRLLGICISPGEPFYLIIEYAEYGSLRNYLRKARPLQSIEVEGITDNIAVGVENNKVTPKEILSFAWQISNGMSYLSEIKLVHRDLAARNILLTSEKVCKISDFGLTRDIYEDSAYLKRSKGRVPVKWMAPESLADHIYTTKSDVWSFGIVIWELATLGATPYPGIPAQNLYKLLLQGYRMEKPTHCSQVLYDMMCKCWHNDPQKRPSFQELSTCLDKMLTDSNEYLDLSSNAIFNRMYFSPMNQEPENNSDSGSVNYLKRSKLYEKCANQNKLSDINFGNEDTEHLQYATSVDNENEIILPKTQNMENYTVMIRN